MSNKSYCRNCGKELEKGQLCELCGFEQPNTFNLIMRHIPGFRTGNKRNMIIALIYYALYIYSIPILGIGTLVVMLAIPFIFFGVKDRKKVRPVFKPIKMTNASSIIVVIVVISILSLGGITNASINKTKAEALAKQQVIAIQKEKDDAADKVIADAKAAEDQKIADAKVIADKKIADAQAVKQAKIDKENARLQAIADKKAEELAIVEQQKADAQAKADADAKAYEERVAYDTGITYDQLARNPNTYKDRKVKFSGKVIQVIEGTGVTQLRIAVDDNYDTVLLIKYDPAIISNRILENDEITLKGVSQGIYTYVPTMGGNITVPLVQVDSFN